MELFKDQNDDVASYSSSTVSVRIGKFDDGQIVIGGEMLEVEPFDVSNDSEEIYLITKEKDTPGPPLVNPKVPSKDLSIHSSHFIIPLKPQVECLLPTALILFLV